MKKTLLQGTLIAALFFSMWFGLARVDWTVHLKLGQAKNSLEEKVGDFLWESIKKSQLEIKDVKATLMLDSLVDKICTANNLDRKTFKVHIVEKDEINAFALPNRHLVIYTGLVIAADNEAELCGVIGHELAHIQLNHVMKSLIKEIGLSALIALTSGSGGSEKAGQIIKLLSSSAYDRNLEKEADIKSVDYLIQSKIAPEPFGNFMYKLATDDSSQYLSWISTHPDSKERAEYIIDYGNKNSMGNKFEPILSPAGWAAFKQYMKGSATM